MTIPYRVTIIADKRAGDAGIDSTEFIDAAARRLAAVGAAQAGPVPVRAANILDIKRALAAAKTAAKGAPLSVQIVGHGLSGQLLLGMTWMTGDDIARTARSLPFFVIDTNPLALGFFQDFRGDIADLTLAGCHVGDVDLKGSGWSINGRSLTYCLSELLMCKVTAAIGFVEATDFDASGCYTAGYTSWTWAAAGPPTWSISGAPEPDRTDPGTPLQIDRITHTYLPAHHARPRDVAATAIVVPLAAKRLEVARATAEMTVNVVGKGEAKLVGSGRYLVTADAQYAVTNRAELTTHLGAAVRA